MAKNKEEFASNSFSIDNSGSEYSFQLKKKRPWWWLLLLLLFLLIGLLLLLKCCSNDTNTPISNNPVQTKPVPQPTDSIAPPVVKPCDELTQAGMNMPESFIFDMGQVGGKFVLEYDTGKLYPDLIVVYDGEDRYSKEIFRFDGTTPDDAQLAEITFTQSKVYIVITPHDSVETRWEITAHCPQ